MMGGCRLCSCTEGCLQLLTGAPPPSQAPRQAQATALSASLASCVSTGLLFQSCSLPCLVPFYPTRSPQAGALAARNHNCQQDGSSGPPGDLADPYFLLLGSPGDPQLAPGWIPSLSFLSSFPAWTDHPLLPTLVPLNSILCIHSTIIYLALTMYKC